MKSLRLSSLIAMLALAACGSSPPTHFFTLTPVSSGARVPAEKPGFQLQVDAFHIPPTLDRKEIVRADGANSIAIDEQDHWGAPLDEMAVNVLAQDLTQRLPQGTVILPDAPTPAAAAHLVVDVANFKQNADGQVQLEGSWTLLQGNPAAPVLHRDVNLRSTATGDDTAAQVAAMSDLIGRLADNIATELSSNPPTRNQVLSTRKGV